MKTVNMVNRFHQTIYSIDNPNSIHIPETIENFYIGELRKVESSEISDDLFCQSFDGTTLSHLREFSKSLGLGEVAKYSYDYDSRLQVGIFNANNSGNRGVGKFLCIMSIDDAKKFCSDSSTKGKASVFVFSEVDTGLLKAKSFMKDDGRFDGLFRDLDIRSVKYWEDIDLEKDFIKYLGK